MKTPTVFALVTIYCLFSGNDASLINSRPYLSLCRQSNPKFQECVRAEMTAAGPILANGVPEFNIPTIEPLLVPKIHLEQGTQNLIYDITLTNLKLHGLSNYNVDNSFINMNTQKLDAKITIPLLYLESDYKLDGKLRTLTVQGNGLFKANLTDVKADVSLTGQLTKRNGQEYVEVKDTAVKLTIGTSKINLGNLYNGEPIKGKIVNENINKNSKSIINEMLPDIEKVASSLVSSICSPAFLVTPKEKLFSK